MKHYYITTEPPIIAVKDEINVGDFITDKYKYWQWNDDSSLLGRLKVIAGLPNQPTIDYSALKDEDCKKIGLDDVEKLWINYRDNRLSKMGNSHLWDKSEAKENFIEGFKTAESLNDKKFSLQQVIDIMKKSYRIKYFSERYFINNLEQSLQTKVFEIEAIVQDNKVKILKVL